MFRHNALAPIPRRTSRFNRESDLSQSRLSSRWNFGVGVGVVPSYYCEISSWSIMYLRGVVFQVTVRESSGADQNGACYRVFKVQGPMTSATMMSLRSCNRTAEVDLSLILHLLLQHTID